LNHQVTGNGALETVMNTHQGKGRVRQVAGRLQQIAGRLFGSKRQQAKGGAKVVGGKVQSSYGDATDRTDKPF
jgi:uncharacterized protein YjbJ (UPF0337 family)